MKVPVLLALSALLPAVAAADEPAAAPEAPPGEPPAKAGPPTLKERFAGTSVLYENSFTVLHDVNLAPEASRVYEMSWIITPSFLVTRHLELALELPLTEELTEGGNTFRNEVLLGDLTVSAGLSPPPPPGKEDFPLAPAFGLALGLPTSKASRAETLILSVGLSAGLSLTAPVGDGLTVSYRVTPTPRLHRATTASTLTPRPCSPALGCTLGETTDTGWRNTAFELVQDASVSLAMLDDKLSIDWGLQLVHGKRWPKSPSSQFDEATLSPPENAGGDPVVLSYSTSLSVTIQPHDFAAFTVGWWTPGGMRDDGGWYNPVGNRYSRVFLDVTLYPAGLGG